MDMTESIAPNSQQVNAEDLIASPRTVTITGVEAGSSEQPVFVHLAEFPGRTYRPSKSMRRVMVAAWGAEAAAYVGRRLTLYREPSIRFGKDLVGGIQISHMSHIDKALNISLTVSRGKRAPFVVQPLPDAPVDPEKVTAAINAIHAAADTTTLDAIEKHAQQLGITGHITDTLNTRRTELGGDA